MSPPKRLNVYLGAHGSRSILHPNGSKLPKVEIEAVARCRKEMPCACSSADEFAAMEDLPTNTEPVGHPCERSQGIAHGGPAIPRLDILPVEIEVDIGVG